MSNQTARTSTAPRVHGDHIAACTAALPEDPLRRTKGGRSVGCPDSRSRPCRADAGDAGWSRRAPTARPCCCFGWPGRCSPGDRPASSTAGRPGPSPPNPESSVSSCSGGSQPPEGSGGVSLSPARRIGHPAGHAGSPPASHPATADRTRCCRSGKGNEGPKASASLSPTPLLAV